MRFITILKPAMLLVMMMALMPMLIPANASAQAATISADIGRCKSNVDDYQVQLQAGNQSARDSAFPASVTIYFADGSTGEATPRMSSSFGTKYYYLDGPRGSEVTGATTQWDTAVYPNFRFTVSSRPCVEAPVPTTYAVTGVVSQQGNQKPVADLTVCLVEADHCTTTDASGSFAISGVEDGTYTLRTDGNNWKEQYNTLTVSGSDVYVDIVQQKGGGNGK